jgi:hypothetical protein
VLDVSLSTASAWHDTLAMARSHRLTSDDAAYLELALRRSLPLAKRDKALQAATRLEGVPLLPC